jgi:hypothetical protein
VTGGPRSLRECSANHGLVSGSPCPTSAAEPKERRCEVLLLFTEASRTDLNVLRSIEDLD